MTIHLLFTFPTFPSWLLQFQSSSDFIASPYVRVSVVRSKMKHGDGNPLTYRRCQVTMVATDFSRGYRIVV
ncbi:hypothetical protein M8C21_007370 [Ambrosia artemisiifolia]|uniref:Uncharacterized protein n=1 Tax=Ambrosia artemisiifolia TaxID=4212 RepID=A0AAD5GCJ4_AMBAR|nr:hypothetical protein M8C21_007370 [Ambrosia artemisiifolia]